mmetsp:Transcript_3487/g.4890  ORF Transcript_3487/g.4890 Transcript_3487/m.4890 type:complete len:636 (-) Transcript_3487:552-2459(-)
MPTVGLIRDDLFARLGKEYSQEEFELLCFEFGIELDDVTSEYEAAKDMGVEGKALENLSKDVVYRIDVPANRYDLLCMEGMVRALRIFQGLEPSPTYKKVKGSIEMIVDTSSTEKAKRPFVVCAVLRGVSFEDPKIYNSFIDLQEKLHQNICRRRTLVAIGTHDLDTLKPPFLYKGDAPDAIEFVPLTENVNKLFKGKALMDHYRTSPQVKHLKPYANIIAGNDVYPVIYDAQKTVLSLPPVINGRHSRIQPSTKNVFIECTATDETKANVVCDTVCAMFSEYCDFTVETVQVKYTTSITAPQFIKIKETPLLSTRTCQANIETIRGTIGLNDEHLPTDQILELCAKMQLSPGTFTDDGTSIQVTVPCTRSDILHAVDIIEDVAIAYGYNNVPEPLPQGATVGAPQPLNCFCDLLRDEIARAGYTEILTHGLCRENENYTLLRRKNDNALNAAVTLLNPASEDFEVVRTTLLVGAFKTLQHNKAQAIKDGLRLFEVSDIVLRDASCDVGAKNDRRLVATYTGSSAGFEILHGLLDRVMALASIGSGSIDFYAASKISGVSYSIKPGNDPVFFPGRAADIILTQENLEPQIIGSLGIVHPDVLSNFDLDYPTSALELRLEPIFILSSPSAKQDLFD